MMFKTIMTFVVRTVFIHKLGQEYLGLDGLFINILNMISLTELGIGTSINYILYKPLAKKDYKKVSMIMSFYKKAYFLIGVIVSVIGFIIMAFIPKIVGNTSIHHLYFIFFLYLLNTVFIYFISYKDTLILADQKNYKLTMINFAINLFMSGFQILILYMTKNFIFYVLIQTIFTLIQRILINRYVTKTYQEVDFSSKDKLPKKEFKKIMTNIKAMFMHKFGFYLVNSTDNIIISSAVGLKAVGLYTNYLSIVNIVTTLLNSLFTAVTSSFGNLIVLEKNETQENVFNIINFGAFILYGYVAVGFAIMLNTFIKLWIGNDYLLANSIVILLCFNFYIMGMIAPIDTVRQASGKYTKDKYVSLIQAFFNIILSIIFVQKMGILGVLLGTTISTLFLPTLIKPYIIYKYVFDKNSKKYYLNYIKDLTVIILIYLGISKVISLCNFSITIWSFIFSIFIISILYFFIIFIIYRKNQYFCYYYQLLKKSLKCLKRSEG